jgi:hypothetical protein
MGENVADQRQFSLFYFHISVKEEDGFEYIQKKDCNMWGITKEACRNKCNTYWMGG